MRAKLGAPDIPVRTTKSGRGVMKRPRRGMRTNSGTGTRTPNSTSRVSRVTDYTIPDCELSIPSAAARDGGSPETFGLVQSEHMFVSSTRSRGRAGAQPAG